MKYIVEWCCYKYEFQTDCENETRVYSEMFFHILNELDPKMKIYKEDATND